MKKKIFLCSLIAICFSVAAYGTLAFFSHEDKATNVITAGDVKIDLQEWTVPENGGDRIPFEDAVDVMPGMEVSKIAEIENIGGQTAWVRISVDKSISLAENKTGEVNLNLVSLDFNTEYWLLQDGYFYYKQPLKSGETTEPLFTKVSFDKDMGNLYQYSKAIIKLNAQATQTANNGDSAITAVGWPSDN